MDKTRLDELRARTKMMEQKLKITNVQDLNQEMLLGKVNVIAEQESNVRLKITTSMASKDYTFHTDEPEINGGNATAPTPVHMLIVALAGCIQTNWIYFSSFSGLDVRDVRVEITSKIDRRFILGKPEYPARLQSLEITSHVYSNEPERKLERVFQKVRDICPVGGSLHPDIEKTYINKFIKISDD